MDLPSQSMEVVRSSRTINYLNISMSQLLIQRPVLLFIAVVV